MYPSKAVNGQTDQDCRFRIVEPFIVQICTYSQNELKDQRLPASSWKHCKHIFSLDEVEQGFFLDRFQHKNIGKTTIERKLYCTTTGSPGFATIVRHFLCFKFLGAKKPVFRARGEHSRESANESSCLIIVTRKGLVLNSNTNQRPSSKFVLMKSEVRNCREQRVFSRSRLRRWIFATNNRKKNPLAPKVVYVIKSLLSFQSRWAYSTEILAKG